MLQNYIKYNAKTASKSTPYFTGKERDSETGFSYFGARYYDSDILTGWLSVDPMADKYPGLSPYAYCAWNTVKLVDPDGEEIADFFDRKGNYLGTDGKNDGKVYMLNEGKRAVTENRNVNWGGVLESRHISELKENSTEILPQSDIGQLARIAFAEFRGQSDIEQQLVADIVLNRVNDSRYPNTAISVINQDAQFTSTTDVNNKDYYHNPEKKLNNTPNINAWRRCVSNAISVYNGFTRGISKGAVLYFSPNSMGSKQALPKWNFNLLQETTPSSVDANNIRCFKYK